MCLLLTWAPPSLWLQMTKIITKPHELGNAIFLFAMCNMCIMDIFSQFLAEQLFMTFFFKLKYQVQHWGTNLLGQNKKLAWVSCGETDLSSYV